MRFAIGRGVGDNGFVVVAVGRGVGGGGEAFVVVTVRKGIGGGFWWWRWVFEPLKKDVLEQFEPLKVKKREVELLGLFGFC